MIHLRNSIGLKLQKQLRELVACFKKTFQISGTVKFVCRPELRLESDTESLVNIYVFPMDKQALISFRGHSYLHLQFLGSMVPLFALNNPFVFRLHNHLGFRNQANHEIVPVLATTSFSQ